mmetsp:Transcript_101888/g.287491  ORF Transcript_101888/g.287491 Transcript_101888/m.287491 type:complete len:130 (-) Transcript_101888:101-490(-)
MWRRASAPLCRRAGGTAPWRLTNLPVSQSLLRPPLLGSARAFGDRRGTVKFFDPQRGYGFIASEGEDFFVHYTGIASSGSFLSLADGEDVEFDVECDPTVGEKRAVRVTGLGGAKVKGSKRVPERSAAR